MDITGNRTLVKGTATALRGLDISLRFGPRSQCCHESSMRGLGFINLTNLMVVRLLWERQDQEYHTVPGGRALKYAKQINELTLR